MAKFASPSKLSKDEQEKLFIRLCRAMSKLNNPTEAARFLKDLLSVQEVEMLAKRLKIAEFLIAGKTYSRICDDLKVSSGTVARVHEWLKFSGDGFRLIIERVSEEEKDKEGLNEADFDPFAWRNIKKKYPLYYWPQLLLEGVIKSAKERDRKRIRESLNQMDKKSALYKRLNKIFLSNQKKDGRR